MEAGRVIAWTVPSVPVQPIFGVHNRRTNLHRQLRIRSSRCSALAGSAETQRGFDSMFVDAWKTTKAALFPVFTAQGVPIGSGFFVAADGLFVTCAHVATLDRLPLLRYFGRLSDGGRHYPPLAINVWHRDDHNDIAVGMVVGASGFGIMDVAKSSPEAGRSVMICGYPVFVDDAGANPSLHAFFQPTTILGSYTFKKQSGVRPSFCTCDIPQFGMSGGPIVDVSGTAVGMQTDVSDKRFSVGAGGQRLKTQHGIAVTPEVLRSAIASARDAMPGAARSA